MLFGIPGRRRWPRRTRAAGRTSSIRFVSLIGYSVPVFWLGLIGLLVFYGKLGWVAGPGRLDVSYELAYEFDVAQRTGSILIDSALAGAWDVFGNALSHIVLPAGVLGYFSLAYIARMTRSFMLEQLGQEYRHHGAGEGRAGMARRLGACARQRAACR